MKDPTTRRVYQLMPGEFFRTSITGALYEVEYISSDRLYYTNALHPSYTLDISNLSKQIVYVYTQLEGEHKKAAK